MGSPEYMAIFARRFVQAGAKFVGGCCGTTPTHIKLIADAIRSISPRQSQVFVKSAPAAVNDLKPADVEVVAAELRSNWSRKVVQGEFVTSVEVLPPKGCDAAKTLDSIRL